MIVYNTDELSADDVPDSVFDLTDPKWKGKIGIAPTNASFQAFVTAMRLDAGEERTRQWLEDLKRNDPKFYERNTPVVEAAASGEIERRARQPLLPLPRQGGARRRRADRRTSTCRATTPARSSASPARAFSTAPTTPTRRSASSSSCSPTSSSASTPRRPRRRRSRSSTGIAPKPGVPTLDELSGRGPDVDLSALRRRARADARAAERDRLHVVRRGQDGGRPRLARPARARHRRAAAPPARVPRGASREQQPRLAGPHPYEHARADLEHGPARARRDSSLGHDRRLGGVADDADRPARAPRLGGRRGACRS